jgi:hypothetical protein
MLLEVDVAWLSTAVTTAPETRRVPNTDSATRSAGRLVNLPPKSFYPPLTTVSKHASRWIASRNDDVVELMGLRIGCNFTATGDTSDLCTFGRRFMHRCYGFFGVAAVAADDDQAVLINKLGQYIIVKTKYGQRG